MPISYADPLELDCPRCGTRFTAETWLIVDGRERRDLVARILDGALHDAVCPQCGQAGAVPAPLLYHDGQAQRVLLAVPDGMPEEEWRAVAQGLLWTLIGALPEARRDPYLGELQAEAGLAGIAAVIQAEQLAGLRPEAEDDPLPPLVAAIQALLVARGPAAIQHVLQRHPILLEPQTVTVLRELAHEAFKQGEEEAATGFSEAAGILNEVGRLPQEVVLRAPADRDGTGMAPSGRPDDPLEEVAFALLRSHTGEMLAAAVDQYPRLLDGSVDAELEAWAGRARSEGKTRIADAIDERIAALRVMREQYEAQRPTLEAIQALLDAGTPDDLEAVLVDHDALFADEADAALTRLVETSDPESAAFVEERRDLVRRVRRLLLEQDRSGPFDAGMPADEPPG